MKRRDFMTGALAGGVLSVTLPSCGMRPSASPPNRKTDTALLTEFRERYRKYLYDEFLPNMDRLVIDHQYGGFMCSVNIATGEQANSNKSAWFEGRGLWTYSFLYNHLKKEPSILEVARKSKDFILASKPEGDEFWTSAFSREGRPITGPGDIYTSLFVAEGLAEYARASAETEYLDMAKDIVRAAMRRYDDPAYSYHVSYLSPQSPKVPAPRVLGHWMIFLRSLTQILEQGADVEMEAMMNRCLSAILDHHLNPEYGLFNELLNHDLSRPENEYNHFAYLGHGIETCWMLMAEARRRKDEQLFKGTAELFKKHVELARDRVYGGYFRSLDHVENNRWKVDKVLWLQEEVLIGALFIAEQTGDPWAMDCFKSTFTYVEEKFALPGYKFWVSASNRTLTENQLVRAEHYHHPRHLMLNLLTLDRLIARSG